MFAVREPFSRVLAVVLLAAVVALFAAACAVAGDTPTSDAARPMPDAAAVVDGAGGMPDARGVPDAAPPPIDAGVADALPPGTNIVCNGHADCTLPTECCFTFGQPPGFCVRGFEVGDLCVPN